MDDFRNPRYAAEPYEESQGRDDSSAASPDAMAAFYKDMEKKEIVERKLSKRKSSSGTSIWSRKSVKRSATAHPAPPPAQRPQPDGDHRDEKRMGEEDREKEAREDNSDKPDWVPQVNSPRSIIPDSKELPAWYNKDAWASVPIPSYKLRYLIHNPVGPLWYKNHHLLPRSETIPAARPPSFFSPSFPPIASSTSQDRSEDATRLPGPSRTPSNSPLPTPNSSQTRVMDKTRSRKTSQTAHDTVDLLDVTDPWGTNWHHHSPYDIGLSNGPISVDVQDVLHTRSRRSSLTTQSRRRTAPSPLSQSTSAIHLTVSDAGAHIPRKLSKRRTPTVTNIFGEKTQNPGRNAISLPTSPLETQPLAADLPKRMSVAPPNGPTMSVNQSSPPKKEKRGSVLGRLVKKFSILKKPVLHQSRVTVAEDDWQHINSDNAPQRAFVPERQPSPEKPHSDAVKRIPPPTIDEPEIKLNDVAKEVDRSSMSFEAPFSIGRLTIANPDTPRSGETTPALGGTPLPPDKLELRDFRTSPYSHQRPNSPSTSPPLASPTEASPPIPEKTASPPPPPPTKESIFETSSVSSPVSMRPPSFDLQRPLPPQKTSTSSAHPAPSIISHTSRTSVRDRHLPGSSTEKLAVSSAHHSGSSSQKPSQPVERPASRSSDKHQPAPLPPKKMRPASVASSIPFPGSEAGDRIQSFADYDNSPLSAASMLANPPTPYVNDMPMPATPEHPPPPLPPRSDNPSVPQVTRQTETFRLVRSPSGHVYASNETIVAGGQQWEVEAIENKGKNKVASKSKSKDRDSKTQESKSRDLRGGDSGDRDSGDRDSGDRGSRDQHGSRREARRESRTKAQPEIEVDSRHRHRSRRDQKPKSGERSTTTSKATRATDSDLGHRETSTGVHQDTGRSSRRRDDRERKSERKQQEASSHSVNVTKAQPSPPAPTPDVPPRPLGRHPSLSARPTSQLPSAEEMNAMRAKEAWDMERLWKARSMQGEELNRYTTIPSNHNTPLIGNINDPVTQRTIYGSSHTAFVVQSPFQSQHSIYHSMPTAPPPIIYSSPSFIPTVASQLPPAHLQSHSRFYSDSMASDRTSYASSVRPPNPLPEPPRESPYEIPTSVRTSEYWTKYAGVTTSH